jgi:hypothetical protein
MPSEDGREEERFPQTEHLKYQPGLAGGYLAMPNVALNLLQ